MTGRCWYLDYPMVGLSARSTQSSARIAIIRPYHVAVKLCRDTADTCVQPFSCIATTS